MAGHSHLNLLCLLRHRQALQTGAATIADGHRPKSKVIMGRASEKAWLHVTRGTVWLARIEQLRDARFIRLRVGSLTSGLPEVLERSPAGGVGSP